MWRSKLQLVFWLGTIAGIIGLLGNILPQALAVISSLFSLIVCRIRCLGGVGLVVISYRDVDGILACDMVSLFLLTLSLTSPFFFYSKLPRRLLIGLPAGNRLWPIALRV